MSVRTALCKILVLGNMLVLAMAVAAAAEPVLRPPSGGTIRTLIVGIDKYPRLGRAAQLGGAVADAEDIADALSKAGVRASPILDGQATRARFVAEMDRLVAESKAGDFVFVSFAGHGMQVPEYPRWKGIEPGGVNEQIVFSGYAFSGSASHDIVVNKELRAWLSRLDAKGVDVLVVMDSCFGGGMVRSADFRTGPVVVRSLPGDTSNDDLKRFVPIDMTEKEARTEIRGLARATFLAGATKDGVVPETQGLEPRDPKAPCGALSFLRRAGDPRHRLQGREPHPRAALQLYQPERAAGLERAPERRDRAAKRGCRHSSAARAGHDGNTGCRRSRRRPSGSAGLG